MKKSFMKRLVALALVIVSVFSISAVAFADSNLSGKVDTSHGSEPGGSVNYYSSYNSTASSSGLTKKGTLSNGTTVTVTDIAGNDHWYSFQKNGTTYYVMRQFVRVAGREGEIRYGTTELNLGSRGRYVTTLQEDLEDLDYDPKGIDGKFGEGTRSALKNFQSANGLDDDGRCGPATRQALYTAITNKD